MMMRHTQAALAERPHPLLRWGMALLAALTLGATAAGAQQQDKDRKRDDIPAAYRPPPGMCRIWIEDVPPAQQPASTDCATAVRNRPENGRVVFGDDYASKKSDDKAPVKGFSGGGKGWEDVLKGVKKKKP